MSTGTKIPRAEAMEAAKSGGERRPGSKRYVKLNRRATMAWKWTRDDEATRDCLLLTGTDVPIATIAKWSDDEVKAAEDWAGAIHHAAADNPVPHKECVPPSHVAVFLTPTPAREGSE